MGNSVTLVVELKGAQLKVDIYQQFDLVMIFTHMNLIRFGTDLSK